MPVTFSEDSFLLHKYLAQYVWKDPYVIPATK